ncbi:hypothetical protein [Marinicella litoralis]|uniref:Uncharacterized protein n=1 Tax=Marinicella litoralis TaxID=644220 RepID=A0A4R6XHY8_9GAMM|nr:hypothetical protein [Marinicella litoralis]TDR16753.1 hypothetical protein C8D91_2659 [Marinicella litoralis]
MKFASLILLFLTAGMVQSKSFSSAEYQAMQWVGATFLSLLLIGVDDQLQEDVRTFLENDEPKNWDDNAYIYLWAIDVASENTYETGKEMSRKVVEANSRYKYEMEPYDSSFLYEYEYISTSNKDFYCTYSFNDCFPAIYLEIENALKHVKTDYVMYERYQQFLKYEHTSPPYIPKFEAPWPNVSVLTYGHQLNQAVMIEKLFNHEHGEFIRLFEDDTLNLKTMYSKTNSALNKMVLLSLIDKNIELIGHLFQLQHIDAELLNSTKILQLLTATELSGYEMLAFELRVMMKIVQELSENPHYLIKPSDKYLGSAITKKLMPLVFKANLTLNSMYHEYVSKVLEYSKLAPADFYIQYDQLNVNVKYDYIRASVSSYLASFITNDKSIYLRYQGRIHSLNMKIQLLNALVEQGSFEKVIVKAEQGHQPYLNHYDQSPPYFENDKICYSGLFEFNDKFRCMSVLN